MEKNAKVSVPVPQVALHGLIQDARSAIYDGDTRTASAALYKASRISNIILGNLDILLPGKDTESPKAKVHGVIHDVCYELGQGNIEKARAMLKDADEFLHDHC